MKKSPKVVPITEPMNKLIADDVLGKRMILKIGDQRVAFDFHTVITNLPPGFGDQAAALLNMTKPEPIKPRLKKRGRSSKSGAEGKGIGGSGKRRS